MAAYVSSWKKKDQAVTALAKALAKQSVPETFTKAFFKDAPPGDIVGENEAELRAIVLAAFAAMDQRKAGSAKIHVSNPPAEGPGGRHTQILLINDDMPFLVDTVTGLLTDMGLEIRRLFHPIVETCRDGKGARIADGTAMRESVIYLDVDRRGPRTRSKITENLKDVLQDNRWSVVDWKAMLKQLSRCGADLKYGEHGLDDAVVSESLAFIDWLAEENFTLLGYRYYPVDKFQYTLAAPGKEHKALGILRDDQAKVWRGNEGMSDASPELTEFLKGSEPILITKANARATVHRRVHMDYIGVKAFDDAGAIVGEHRFVGLFTSAAYARQARSIPLLRRKIDAVCGRAGFEANSHAGKALLHTLETFPRDELFQIDAERLHEFALGVLSLYERPRPRVFVRPDRFERFVSVFVYVPRDLYAGNLREKVGTLLSKTFNGSVSVFFVKLGDEALTRVQYIIRTEPGTVPAFDEAALNTAVEQLVKGWSETFLDGLTETFGDDVGRRLFYSVRGTFSASYREEFTPHEAVEDVEALRTLVNDDTRERAFRLYRRSDQDAHQSHLKIYRQDQILALSDSLPSLENLGLRVIDEVSFSIGIDEDKAGWVHDYTVETQDGAAFDVDTLSGYIATLLGSAASGARDDDGYNTLALAGGLAPDDIHILRAYGSYIRQLGLPFTRSYVERCLVRNAPVASLLAQLFAARFDPALKPKAREKDEKAGMAAIEQALESVQSQDDDRILRLFQSAITATLRTNAYCQDGSCQAPDTLAIKLQSRDVLEMPQPAPHAEIFVYGPDVEGVHLRGGPVARGGLRWTDRPEDYRTEILGLLKAQIVKNSVIVPVGAKGGFLPRRLPVGGTRDEIFEAGRAAYQVFICHLIALTDNIVDGEIVPPQGVIRHDGDDPYLVVAADKGTATFSDTANAIAQDMGFWLDDAFASGGSQGYDHKKMGITARGGWVSVQRHFREMGVNTQSDRFSVVGVGDMSGDVFGNGMLLSETICLVGAFDHRNIFIDPDPDPKTSFAERKRLFEMPRSSWMEYNPKLLSKGGKIYDRNAKKLELTPQIKARFGLNQDSCTPQELMRAVLLAQADLLWFGGIGTYVKGSDERNGEVGDRANDAIRVDGDELHVKVIGEGANLGITMEGRMAFSRVGGRLNADFIDNSAGVDCSDNEVNLKIALSTAVKAGKLTPKKRDNLLARMTDDVADLVLRDNYLQTQAISMAQAQAAKSLDRHADLIRRLEREERIVRALDGLPSEDEITDLASKDKGLPRPQLASLMCHAKIAVFDALIDSDVVDDPALEDELIAAFPAAMQKTYGAEIKAHRLRREIIATKLANAVINRGGLTLIFELDEMRGCGLARAVAAFVVVRQLFGLRAIWRGIDAGDYTVPANIQTLMHAEVAFSLRRQMLRLLQEPNNADRAPWTITDALDHYGEGLNTLLAAPAEPLIGLSKESFVERRDMYLEQGAQKDVASAIAALDAYSSGLLIVGAARDYGNQVGETAKAYFLLAKATGTDWLRQQLTQIAADDPWDRRAVSEMEADLAQQQTALVGSVLAPAGVAPEKEVADWLGTNTATIDALAALFENLRQDGPATIARLSYCVRVLRSRLMPLL
ncbi:MAG: NAD-glutamate dehydrogenase [Pseudomonadota bacterium]